MLPPAPAGKSHPLPWEQKKRGAEAEMPFVHPNVCEGLNEAEESPIWQRVVFQQVPGSVGALLVQALPCWKDVPRGWRLVLGGRVILHIV